MKSIAEREYPDSAICKHPDRPADAGDLRRLYLGFTGAFDIEKSQ